MMQARVVSRCYIRETLLERDLNLAPGRVKFECCGTAFTGAQIPRGATFLVWGSSPTRAAVLVRQRDGRFLIDEAAVSALPPKERIGYDRA